MPKKDLRPRLHAVDGDGRASRIKAERVEIDFGDGRRLLLSLTDAGQGELKLRALAAGETPVIRLQRQAADRAILSVEMPDESDEGGRGEAHPPVLNLSVQKALDEGDKALAPKKHRIRRWAQAALRQPAEVTVRLVGEPEGRELNRTYRGKDYATNVLTFVYGAMEAEQDGEEGELLAGDLVLCVPVVAREAAEQGKPLDAHFAHLVVHGMLHLQGYDHEAADDAEAMEALETDILESLGYIDPYA